ncbi:NAD(P)/FAD-dependent oxidoreductase [Candidatus Woesearchaeota archaeon]|nr:NAD(P)/FAD-dependent oxidoreductase [Candidatus Woesearchaeota archaeon]
MITIIGAGPAGSYTAKLLAKKGRDVEVIEEHSEIGNPVQCTGIVTQKLTEHVNLKKFTVNKLRKVRLHSKNNTAQIRTKDLVIDRALFDKHIAEMAKNAGAIIQTGSRVTGISAKISGTAIKVKKKGNTSVVKTDMLVGADGPKSIVSRYIGNRLNHWKGIQAVVKMPTDKETYDVYFGDEFPGFFGWVVPENEETARIGIAAEHNAPDVFKRFMKRFPEHKVLHSQGGLIPIYNRAVRYSKDNICVVGDAAAQVKATTGGGLVPGMNAAKCLAESIITGNKYDKLLKPVLKDLNTSQLIRNVLDRFNDKDYDTLLEVVKDKKMLEIFNKEDRDSPTRTLFKVACLKPSILRFAGCLLRAKRL